MTTATTSTKTKTTTKLQPFKRGDRYVFADVTSNPRFVIVSDGVRTSRIKRNHFTKGYTKTTAQAVRSRHAG